MTRKARTSEDVKRRFADPNTVPPSGNGSRRRKERVFAAGEEVLNRMETVSLVTHYFCKGMTAAEIRRVMRTKHNVELAREDPWLMVHWAAAHGMIQPRLILDHTAMDRIRERHPWLDGVEVVNTAVFDDVANRAANMLLNLVRKVYRSHPDRSEVHIALAGGYSMWKLARAFAELLTKPVEGLPSTLVCHAMVSGFDLNDPRTDPNAFVIYFMMDHASKIETRFVGMYAPAIVRSEQIRDLKELAGIRRAYDAVKEIDIIATSASVWADPHSMLYKSMQGSESSIKILQRAGCVGDLLWRPIGSEGPIETETEIRAMTLCELTDLPRFIRQGKHVLLVLGPCGGCNRAKGPVLKTILGLKEKLITHLAVDHRTANDACPDED